MSAERSTESIIDLLYGELSEEEAKQMRAELAESAELRAEHDELDMMLGRVRESMPMVDVSPAIHDAIMDAARAGVPTGVDERVMRRTPEESRGFWRRISGGQGSQLALVAAVLIAGAFVVKFVERSNSPLHAAGSDISRMEEAAPAPAPAAMAKQEAEEEQPEGAADRAAAGNAVADQWSEAEADEAADSKLDALAMPAEEAEPSPEIANSLRKELEATKTARATEPAPKTVAKAEPKKKETRARRKSSSAKPAPKQDAVAEKKSARLDSDMLGLLDQAAKPTSTSSNSGALAAAAPEPEPEPVAAEEEAAEPQYRAPQNSIDSVNQYFRRGDYGGAIRAADQFLTSNPSASNTEKATAMHIKAQSLVNTGKYSEADRLYQSIQTNYPGFQSAAIQSAREEIRRRNTKRKARPSSPKKSADDSTDYMFESMD